VIEATAHQRLIKSPQAVPSASLPGRDLFGDDLPAGFRYQGDVLSSAEARLLVAGIERLPFLA
jgi:hypothetical protein